MQRELEVATRQLEKWRVDNDWLLELVEGQEKEKSSMQEQLRCALNHCFQGVLHVSHMGKAICGCCAASTGVHQNHISLQCVQDLPHAY